MSVSDAFVSEMRRCLSYDPETGVWIRLVPSGIGRAGEVAGTVHSKGYRQIRVRRKRYTSSRLAFLWMTGQWPDGPMDHINGIRDDDRWANLRPATPALNNANSRRRSDNRSGYKGVRWHAKSGRWQARITRIYQVSLGLFDTPQAAHAAYCQAANTTFGEFANPG